MIPANSLDRNSTSSKANTGVSFYIEERLGFTVFVPVFKPENNNSAPAGELPASKACNVPRLDVYVLEQATAVSVHSVF